MSSSSDYDDIVVNKFNEEAAKKFRSQVLKRAALDESMPIVVYIDSYGGYIDSLNNMLDTIEQVPNQIVTVCTGKAMSCGAVLLAAGDFRYCGRNSRVMVHQGSSGTGGPIEALQNDVDESKRINKQLMTKIAERCGMTYTQFKKEMKARLHRDDDEARDLYLPPEAALEIGIVDYVGMPVIKPVVMYSIECAPEKKYQDPNNFLAETLEEALDTKKVAKKKTKKKVAKKPTRRKTTKKK
jgi:ATP-dependent Clp protease protease subunit